MDWNAITGEGRRLLWRAVALVTLLLVVVFLLGFTAGRLFERWR